MSGLSGVVPRLLPIDRVLQSIEASLLGALARLDPVPGTVLATEEIRGLRGGAGAFATEPGQVGVLACLLEVEATLLMVGLGLVEIKQ